MNLDDRLKWTELLIKYLAIFSTIIGAGIGTWQYFETRKTEANNKAVAEAQAHEQRQKEFRLGFFNRRIDLYLEACRVAGTISSALSAKDEPTQKLIDRFYGLYWGELSAVEDPPVEAAMVKFERAMREWQQKNDGMATDEMRRLSYALAHACRKSLEDTYEVSLGKLPEKPVEAKQSRDGN